MTTELFVDICNCFILGRDGWLGWENNLDDFVARVAGFGVLDALRGFATNVANYQPLGELCPEGLDCIDGDDAARQHACCADPCRVLQHWGWGNSEAHYALILSLVTPATIPGFTPRMLIDTSRNGGAVSNCRAMVSRRS